MLPAQTRPARCHRLALLDAVRAPRSRHTSRLGASDMSCATRTGVTAPRGACVAALSPRAPGRVACKINYFLLGSTTMHPWVLATTWPSLGSGGKRPCIWSAGVYTAPRATRGAGAAPTALRRHQPCRAPSPELLASRTCMCRFFQFLLMVVTVALAGRFPHGHSHRAESSMAVPFIPLSHDVTIGGQWASVPSIWLCDQRPATSGGPHASGDKRG